MIGCPYCNCRRDYDVGPADWVECARCGRVISHRFEQIEKQYQRRHDNIVLSLLVVALLFLTLMYLNVI